MEGDVESSNDSGKDFSAPVRVASNTKSHLAKNALFLERHSFEIKFSARFLLTKGTLYMHQIIKQLMFPDLSALETNFCRIKRLTAQQLVQHIQTRYIEDLRTGIRDYVRDLNS